MRNQEVRPIFVITGSPAVGKSTFADALMKRFPLGLHLPVDQLREFVVSGIAHPMEWCDETTRQFKLAEEGAADLAIRYNDAGFAVAIEGCQAPPNLNELVATRFAGRPVLKIALVTDLETNHRRNRERTNKNFDHRVLTKSIDNLNPLYRTYDLSSEGWIIIDNSADGIGAAVDAALGHVQKPA